jgi:hypothetical protein
MKVYRSFEEINLELDILKLETELEKEKLKRSFFNLKRTFAPVNILSSLVSSMMHKSFYTKLLQKLLPF